MTTSMTRRKFFSLTGAAAAVTGAAVVAPKALANALKTDTVATKSTSLSDTAKRIHVTSEYGRLKEVIVGRTPKFDDKYFNYSDGYERNMPWLKPETVTFLKENPNSTWGDVYGVEGYEKLVSQVEGFVSALEQQGVKVIRPKAIEGKNAHYIDSTIDQIWPRDVFCTVGNNVIVSSLRMSFKRKQQYAFTGFYSNLMKQKQCKYLSAPQAGLDIFTNDAIANERSNSENICLDGGDFFVDGKNIYLGIGEGSNMNGYEWLESMYGDEYTITPLMLDEKALHLDCALSLLSPNLALICRDWIKSDLPESLAHYTFIDVNEEEASWLAANGLPISPYTCIMDKAHQRVINEVRKHGHNVIEVEFDMPSMLGGALRCASQPIYREPV